MIVPHLPAVPELSTDPGSAYMNDIAVVYALARWADASPGAACQNFQLSG
jgi:hypothetical protein